MESIYGSRIDNPGLKPDFGLTSSRLGNGQTRLTLPTKPGVRYQLRCSEDLAKPRLSWQKVGAPIIGTGANSIFDFTLSGARRFYRFDVSLTPLP